MQHKFITIARVDIFDSLCEAVDNARGLVASDDPWMGAINRAWDYLLQTEAISFDREHHAIRVSSATRNGRAYVANGDCQCEAFTRGTGICWHRAAARLVRRALELEAARIPAPVVVDAAAIFAANRNTVVALDYSDIDELFAA